MNATRNHTAFRLSVSIAVDIDAPPARVWDLLTDAAGFPTWNSTVVSIDGEIAEGQSIKLVAHSAPGRVFNLKISDVVANESMVWSDGFAPMFRGARTFRLTEREGGVRFEMVEVFSGLMLPLIVRSLPDFGPVFEAYAADLKAAAEG